MWIIVWVYGYYSLDFMNLLFFFLYLVGFKEGFLIGIIYLTNTPLLRGKTITLALKTPFYTFCSLLQYLKD